MMGGTGLPLECDVLCPFQLLPTDGMIRKHSHVKIGRYHQVTPVGWQGATSFPDPSPCSVL